MPVDVAADVSLRLDVLGQRALFGLGERVGSCRRVVSLSVTEGAVTMCNGGNKGTAVGLGAGVSAGATLAPVESPVPVDVHTVASEPTVLVLTTGQMRAIAHSAHMSIVSVLVRVRVWLCGCACAVVERAAPVLSPQAFIGPAVDVAIGVDDRENAPLDLLQEQGDEGVLCTPPHHRSVRDTTWHWLAQVGQVG